MSNQYDVQVIPMPMTISPHLLNAYDIIKDLKEGLTVEEIKNKVFPFLQDAFDKRINISKQELKIHGAIPDYKYQEVYFSGNVNIQENPIKGIDNFFPECGGGAEKILGKTAANITLVINTGAAAADAGPAQGTEDYPSVNRSIHFNYDFMTEFGFVNGHWDVTRWKCTTKSNNTFELEIKIENIPLNDLANININRNDITITKKQNYNSGSITLKGNAEVFAQTNVNKNSRINKSQPIDANDKLNILFKALGDAMQNATYLAFCKQDQSRIAKSLMSTCDFTVHVRNVAAKVSSNYINNSIGQYILPEDQDPTDLKKYILNCAKASAKNYNKENFNISFKKILATTKKRTVVKVPAAMTGRRTAGMPARYGYNISDITPRVINVWITWSDSDLSFIKNDIIMSINNKLNSITDTGNDGLNKCKLLIIPPFLLETKILNSEATVLNTDIQIPENCCEEIKQLKNILDIYVEEAQSQALTKRRGGGNHMDVNHVHDMDVDTHTHTHMDMDVPDINNSIIRSITNVNPLTPSLNKQSYNYSDKSKLSSTKIIEVISNADDSLTTQNLIVSEYLSIIYYLNTNAPFFEHPLQQFNYLFDKTNTKQIDIQNINGDILSNNLSMNYLLAVGIHQNYKFQKFFLEISYNNSNTYPLNHQNSSLVPTKYHMFNYDEILILYLLFNKYFSGDPSGDAVVPSMAYGKSKKKSKNKKKVKRNTSKKKKVKRVAKRKDSRKKRNKKK